MTLPSNDLHALSQLSSAANAIREQLRKKIIGQNAIITDLLACFFASGHCLLVGVPGLAKTMLIQSVAQCLACDFSRIQFTPDLMPADITGSEILIEDKATGHREFNFIKGPIFSNIILADEINRTPPKTQSALLESMQEHKVTSSGRSIPLPAPFWVLATQNPIEQEGTYPLPEAQQDRFMFSLVVGYPSKNEEESIVRMTTSPQTAVLDTVLTREELCTFQQLVLKIPAADSVVSYAVALARATRPDDPACPESYKKFIAWGAGPRASQNLVLAAKVYAALEGRPAPDVDDVKRAALPVLRHRIVRSFHAEVDSLSADAIIMGIVDSIAKQ
jgi:MoxR-like ATPase